MYSGDRECPNCGEESLVEETLIKWVCQNPDCKEEYTNDELDVDIEDFED